MNSLCNHFEKMNIEEKESCCICLDELEKTGVTTLKCGHTIHLNCFMEFMLCGINHSNNSKCPLCRNDIGITDDVKTSIQKIKTENIDTEEIMFIDDIQRAILLVLKSEIDYSYTPNGIRDLINEKCFTDYSTQNIKKNCEILLHGSRLNFMRGRNGRHMYGYNNEFLEN